MFEEVQRVSKSFGRGLKGFKEVQERFGMRGSKRFNRGSEKFGRGLERLKRFRRSSGSKLT